MTVLELLRLCEADAKYMQLHINSFIDDFRKSSRERRSKDILLGPGQS